MKYGLIKVVNFNILSLKSFWKTVTLKCIQHTIKENLLLLKGLLKLYKIFKHMAIVSKSVYFDFLDDIVKNYNNTFHRTMKMKPIDVKSTSYVEHNENSNEKGRKF